MSIRKLLDWKTLFIYVHRWTGIFFGLFFVVWFVSGIAMMYVRMPVLSPAERLGHVPPLDLSTFIVAPLVFGVVAAIASLVPAHRATRVDPLIALRFE